jgi:hypothetical protein
VGGLHLMRPDIMHYEEEWDAADFDPTAIP